MTALDGAFVLHLHAHLPDVRAAADWAEDWYFGAVFDVYLPLIDLARGWLRDGVEARVGLSVSPPLALMMADEDLAARCAGRLRGLARLSEMALERGFAPAAPWAVFRRDAERRAHRFDVDLGRALIPELARLQAAGVLELSTSGATHGFFPFLASVDPALVDAQIAVGLARHERLFGQRPVGFWLPECGYFSGLDAHLDRAGVGYVFVDAHAARGAACGTGSPLLTPAGVVAFPRDVECAIRVWSPEVGYPGDERYREFHRDIGRELQLDLLAAAGLPTDGRPLGVRLHRVTDRAVDVLHKEAYAPDEAEAAAAAHAEDFVAMLHDRAGAFRRATGRTSVLAAPYDAELFGHWWGEGPIFLDRVVRRLARGGAVRAVTASDVLRARPQLERREPGPTSWGRGGFASTWLTPENHWVQDAVADVSRRLRDATRSRRGPEDDAALDVMAAAALDLAASDWPFLMTAGSFADYAERRVREHEQRFEAAWAARERGEPVTGPAAPDVSWRAFARPDDGAQPA